jgi:hypothetical protein
LVRTRQNRGTLEKYYRSVARSFRVDAALLPAAGDQSPESDALLTMLANMFDGVSTELRNLINAGHGQEGIEEQGILTYCELQATEAETRKLRRKLERLVASLAKEDKAAEAKVPGDLRRFRFMLVFYPVDLDGE